MSEDDLLRFVYVDALRRRDERIADHIVEGEAAAQLRVEEFAVTQNLLAQALYDPVIAVAGPAVELVDDVLGPVLAPVFTGRCRRRDRPRARSAAPSSVRQSSPSGRD